MNAIASDQPDIRNAGITRIQEEGRRARQPNADETVVAFPSVLSKKMNRRQEQQLVELCKTQRQNLDNEMGRSETHINSSDVGNEWWGSRRQGRTNVDRERLQQTFFGKRWIFEATYYGNLDWRRSIPKSTFRHANLTLGTSRRITDQRMARFCRFFFETTPFWAAQPVGTGDKKFANKVRKICDLKLNESGTSEQMRMAIARACIIGEAVLHTHRYVLDDYYDEEIECLIDTTGKPIAANDGDYITKDDEWIESAQMQLVAVQPTEGAAGGGTAVVQEPQLPLKVLKRDPTTTRRGNKISIFPDTALERSVIAQAFAKRIVKRRTVHYSGARSSLVPSRDFLCSLTEPDIQTAPCIIHLDRVNASAIAQQYAADPSAETVAKAAAILRNALYGTVPSDDPTAPAASQPNTAAGDYIPAQSPISGVINVGHFYVKCDPTGEGFTSDVYVLMDIRTWTPIYYHYTAACSPTRRRPYQIVRTRAVEGRWYGQGEMEQFHNSSMLIDLFLCAAARTQSWSGRVIFFDGSKTLEGQGKTKLKFEWGETYTPIGNAKAEDILQVVAIPDNKSFQLLEMLQLLQQAATNQSGTANANDAKAAGLQTAETATGVNSINDAGNELTSLPVADLRPGLTCTLDDFVFVTLRFHDRAETFTVFEGDMPEEFLLDPKELRNVKVNVNILLTSFDAQRRAAQAQNGIMIYRDWRGMALTDPAGAAAAIPLYVDALQANALENADELINAEQIPPPMAMPGAPGVPGAAPPPDGQTAQPAPGAEPTPPAVEEQSPVANTQ